ncbi:hypothetical protein [Thiobacillus sp.]|uniref:hypothetical protein n=1 Tax=Thiobacillus sp. TaxID=924 RepID=UPI0026011245|nr:hypothetical protein [Thiobacillus sp.]
MRFVKAALFLLRLAKLGIGLFMESGRYNPGADSPHWRVSYALLQAVRERSVERHASTIVVLPRSTIRN